MATHQKPITTDFFTDGKVDGTTVNAGDTIVYDPSTHTGNQTFNGFHGESEDNPIFIDVNGRDVDAQNENIAFRLTNCSNIEVIDGTFRNSSAQGVYTPESWGITLRGITSLDHVGTLIRIGLQSAVNVPAFQRGFPFIDTHAILDSCIAKGSSGQGEGFYMGASDPHEYPVNADGTIFQSALLQKGRIFNGVTDNTGFDGIQMGSCLDGLIYGNEVSNFGTQNDAGDMQGIQLGQGTSALCYDNYIHDYATGSTGFGIFSQSDSSKVYNNIIDNVYNGINAGNGMYQGDNANLLVVNNSISQVKGLYGVNVNSWHLRSTRVQNNLIHFTTLPNDTTTFYIKEVTLPTNYVDPNNFKTYEAQDALATIFTDPSTDDFTLKAGSPALSGGLSVDHLPSVIKINKAGELRGSTPNRGAY